MSHVGPTLTGLGKGWRNQENGEKFHRWMAMCHFSSAWCLASPPAGTWGPFSKETQQLQGNIKAREVPEASAPCWFHFKSCPLRRGSKRLVNVSCVVFLFSCFNMRISYILKINIFLFFWCIVLDMEPHSPLTLLPCMHVTWINLGHPVPPSGLSLPGVPVKRNTSLTQKA